MDANCSGGANACWPQHLPAFVFSDGAYVFSNGPSPVQMATPIDANHMGVAVNTPRAYAQYVVQPVHAGATCANMCAEDAPRGAAAGAVPAQPSPFPRDLHTPQAHAGDAEQHMSFEEVLSMLGSDDEAAPMRAGHPSAEDASQSPLAGDDPDSQEERPTGPDGGESGENNDTEHTGENNDLPTWPGFLPAVGHRLPDGTTVKPPASRKSRDAFLFPAGQPLKLVMAKPLTASKRPATQYPRRASAHMAFRPGRGEEAHVLEGKWNGKHVGTTVIRPKLPRTSTGGGDDEDDDDDDDDEDDDEDDDGDDDEAKQAKKQARLEFKRAFVRLQKKKTVSFEFNKGEMGNDMRKRALAYAISAEVYGNAKKRRSGGDDEDDEDDDRPITRELDHTALGKAGYHGDTMHLVDVMQREERLRTELFHARQEIAYLRGEKLGQLPTERFHAPGPWRTASENRQSRKILSKMAPQMNRMWELGDADSWGTKGLDEAVFHFIKAKCKCSNISAAYQWVNGPNILRMCWDDPVTRVVMESGRKKVKFFTPSEFLVDMRKHHVGQKPMRGMRKFMKGQCYSEQTLREYDEEAYMYLLLIVPCGETIDAPIELAADADADAILRQAAEAAEARAKVKVERFELERTLLKSKGERERSVAIRKRQHPQEGEEDEDEEEPPALVDGPLGGGVMAETYDEHGRTVIFLLEILKGLGAKGRYLPVLLGQVLRVARHRGIVAAEVHLLVRIRSDAGEKWIRTLPAIAGYEMLGFRDRTELTKPLSKVGVMTLNNVPLEEGGVPLQRYMVVSVQRLEAEIRRLTRHGTGCEHVTWFETNKYDERLARHAAWRQLVEAEHDNKVVRKDGTTGDGAQFDDLTPEYGEKMIILGTTPPAPHSASFMPLMVTKTTNPIDENRWLRHFGVEDLGKLLGLLMLARNLYSDPSPRSNSASFGYTLATDASSKHAWGGSKVHRQMSNVVVTPKCWGITPCDTDQGWWGPAAIKHKMDSNGSVAKSGIARCSFTDDHRASLDLWFAGYLKQMTALRAVDPETGEGSLRLNHAIYAWPPIVYNRDGTVKKTFPCGKPNDIDDRFACFSAVHLQAHGVVGLDLSAANELCGKEVDYKANKASSFAHNTLHKDQSKHGTIAAIPDTMSPEEFVESLWPNCPEMMTASMLFNDGRVDVTNCIVEPAQQRTKRPQGAAAPGTTARVPTGAGAARNAADRTARTATPNGAQAFEYGGSDAADELRRRGFHPHRVGREDEAGGIDSFVSDVDSSTPDAWTTKTPGSIRLMIIPHVPVFGERTLVDICGGDPELAKFYMLLCTLHLDMRIKELITDTAERVMRDPMANGSVSAQLQGVIDAFNKIMRTRDMGPLRHQIQMNTGGKNGNALGSYPSALDGSDARNLNNSWVKLANDDLDARPLVLSCPYFQSLQTAYEDMGKTSESEIDDLAELAKCAMHFALAMRALRKSADDMRAEMRRFGDNERTYRAFEKHATLFCVKWTILGHRHKGYGFHLWASMKKLFRRYGCMEVINQSVMEGQVGQLKKVLQHCQLNAAGDYKHDVKLMGEAAIEAERAERQAKQKLPAQVVHKHFMLVTMHTEYSFCKIRSKKVKTSYSPSDVCLMIDQAVEKGNVYPASELHEANRLYKLFEKLKHYAHACAAVMRAAKAQAAQGTQGLVPQEEGCKSRYYESYLEARKEYYATYPLIHPGQEEDGAGDLELERAHNMRMRKADWELLAPKKSAYENEWAWGPGSDLSAMRRRAKAEMDKEAAKRAAGTWVPKVRA